MIRPYIFIFICIPLICLVVDCSAQGFSSWNSINTGGDDFGVSGLIFSSTIGQVTFLTMESDTMMVTQGFHQPLPLKKPQVKDNACLVRVYPNPVEGELIVEYSESSILRIEVYDGLGRTVNLSVTPSKVNLSSLRSGVYYFRALCSDGDYFTKTLTKL